jgi:hypothetical protein
MQRPSSYMLQSNTRFDTHQQEASIFSQKVIYRAQYVKNV